VNILYTITGLGLGGAEIATIDIANNMVNRGHRVMILYLKDINVCSQKIHSNIKVVGLNMSKSPFSLLKALFKYKQLVSDFKPEVIHSNMYHANMLSRLIKLIQKHPLLISSEHNKNIEGREKMLFYRITDVLSDINTNVSNEATDYFVKKHAFSLGKSITVYNGIDINKFKRDENDRIRIRQELGISSEEFVFVNVGRLTIAKDQINLLRAFEKVLYSKLIIVGSGKLREEIEKYVINKNMQNRVLLLGKKLNVHQFYSAADCFVLSSRWEGFGIALVEAMSCELPVITTDAGGCREVCNNSEFVVPVKDSESLARKMIYIQHMTKDDQRKLGKANHEQAGKFNIDIICDLWEKIYFEKSICSLVLSVER